MNGNELTDILKGEKAFFEGLDDLKEVILYGSALIEPEITDDIDLLLVPARGMSAGEEVELRQKVWERLKDRVPVMLDVQTPKEGLDKETLSSNDVAMTVIFTR